MIKLIVVFAFFLLYICINQKNTTNMKSNPAKSINKFVLENLPVHSCIGG